MKYGILFSTVAVLMVVGAWMHGGWYLLALWPALSFALVAAGYFRFGPAVFGKSSHGTLRFANRVVLLPYLLYLWAVWYALRLVKREAAYDRLTDDIVIGRRLLGREFPDGVDHVIDLTSEFTEPAPMRAVSYHSFQVLDASVPPPEMLRQWVSQAAAFSGTTYIHCAEGHGRTGLFAAALLLQTGHSQSPAEALEFIRSKRPLVRLGGRQHVALAQFHNATVSDSRQTPANQSE